MQLVQRNFDAGRLQFTTNVASGVEHGRIQFIAVGTPPDGAGAPDLQDVLVLAITNPTYMESPKIIVGKSTEPVGTAGRASACVAAVIAERSLTLGFDVVSNPGFLKEGAPGAGCQCPGRIVTGNDSPAVEEKNALVLCAI